MAKIFIDHKGKMLQGILEEPEHDEGVLNIRSLNEQSIQAVDHV